MPRLTRHAGGLFLAAALLLFVPPLADAKVYKWVDDNGVAHYTVDRNEIPPQYRRRLRPAQGAPMEISLEAPPPEARPGFGPEAGAMQAEPPPPLVLRHDNVIAELETKIAAYREELKTLISHAEQADTEFVNNPRVREIASELPGLQSQLEELRRETER